MEVNRKPPMLSPSPTGSSISLESESTFSEMNCETMEAKTKTSNNNNMTVDKKDAGEESSWCDKDNAMFSPFRYVKRPHQAKNPKLSVEVDAWEEQPVTMIIGWIGMAQLGMLAFAIGSAVFGLRALLIRAVAATGIAASYDPAHVVTSAMLILSAPVGLLVHDVIARIVIFGVAWLLDTFWCYVSLKLYATRPASIVHDGLPCGYGVNFLRTCYNEDCPSSLPRKTQSMYIVYPCRPDDSCLNTHESQPMEYGWSGWSIKESSEEEIHAALTNKATIGPDNVTGRHQHAIVYLHGGGFVAANAGVLLQQAVTMARFKQTVVYALEYPLAPTHPFPAAVCSTLQALNHIRATRGVTHVTIVGDSAGGSIASYVTTLVTSPKLYERFVNELPLHYPKGLPWSFPTVSDGGKASCVKFPNVISHVAVYGVLDDRTYYEQSPLPTITWWENILARHGLKFCMDCYRGSVAGRESCLSPQPADLWVEDNVDWDARAFPPTLLLCGNQDPLLASTELASRRLGCRVQIFAGRHAIVGFLRAWLSPELRSQAAQADASVNEFIHASASAAMEKVGRT